LLCVAALLALAGVTLGQNIEAKLSQEAVHLPPRENAFDQLTDIAKWYKTPMGIERVGEDGQVTQGQGGRDFEHRDPTVTVRGLIEEVLKAVPGYRVRVADGVLLIGKPEIMESRRNFLNITIPHYKVSEQSVYGAEFQLRLAIDMTLEPEKYAKGYDGGYGHPPDTLFSPNNLNIDLSDARVREIMSEIIRQNGHGMWVVHLVPARTKPAARFFAQDGWPTPGFEWRFVPLDQPQSR